MQSSKTASGNKCNWLFGPHCILPSGHSEKLLHRLAPYQAVQREKSLESKGLAGHCEGLLEGSGGQGRKSDDAASQNPAALAGLGRKGKVIQQPLLSSRHHPVSKPLVFISVSSFVDFCEQDLGWECLPLTCPCVCWIIINCSWWLPLSRIHSSECCSFLASGCSDPRSPSLLSIHSKCSCIGFIPTLFPAAWLSRAPHRQIKPQGAKAILLPIRRELP